MPTNFFPSIYQNLIGMMTTNQLVQSVTRKLLLFWVGATLTFTAAAQEKYTISGYVRDAEDGETLIGATVFAAEAQNGATTNVYGFYSLSLPAGTYKLVYSYVGYKEVSKTLKLEGNQKIDVELSADAGDLEEVVITGEREDENVKSMEMSVNKVDIGTIKKMPALLGEVDVIRSIQLLPGVSTVGEGATGFNVRGGGVGQNLVLLDEAPVYNSSHLFGFFSVFNPDAVKDVKLIKGGIPAQYGGRLSSILDVRMKEGNTKKFSAEGGIGAIFSRLTLSNPINKGKGSFVVAGRRSYADILAQPFLNEDLKGSKFYFYDLSAKVNYRFNEKNQVFISGYFGRDVFDVSDIGFLSNWGNGTGTLRWNHLFNDRLFSNTTAFYSKYDYELGFGEDQEDRFDWVSSIETSSIKQDLTYYLNPKNVITFGGQATLYNFDPGNAVGVSAGLVSDVSLPDKRALEMAVYAGNEETISPKLSLQYGLRWSYFSYIGDGTVYEFGEAEATGERRPVTSFRQADDWESIQTYNNFEPRFSLKYELSPSSSVKASYNRMAQYIHLISNTTASTPLDVWTPSTNNIKPQIADQIALGLFKNLKDNTYEASVEVYYKDIQNHIDYIDGADLLLNQALEGDLLAGSGRAYGAEFFFKKTKGTFNGWVSYTLARTERKVEGINNDEWYPARFDQTHNFNAVVFYDLTKRVSFSANFAIVSGTPANFPTTRYEVAGVVVPHNPTNSRNNVRIPAYHRLDLSMQLQGKKKEGKKKEDYWVFSIYNVYNRKNPFSIYFQQNPDRAPVGTAPTTEAIRLAIFGSVIPSVSYNFKF